MANNKGSNFLVLKEGTGRHIDIEEESEDVSDDDDDDDDEGSSGNEYEFKWT